MSQSCDHHWYPQGHPFTTATTRGRAGNHELARAREIQTLPSSNGWRSASSALLRNSASSSRKSTPRCARLISPGRGTSPPPTGAASLTEWCGALNGRRLAARGCGHGLRLRLAAAAASAVIPTYFTPRTFGNGLRRYLPYTTGVRNHDPPSSARVCNLR